MDGQGSSNIKALETKNLYNIIKISDDFENVDVFILVLKEHLQTLTKIFRAIKFFQLQILLV